MCVEEENRVHGDLYLILVSPVPSEDTLYHITPTFCSMCSNSKITIVRNKTPASTVPVHSAFSPTVSDHGHNEPQFTITTSRYSRYHCSSQDGVFFRRALRVGRPNFNLYLVCRTERVAPYLPRIQSPEHDRAGRHLGTTTGFLGFKSPG